MARPLEEYRRKRDRSATPEPFAGRKHRGGPVFVVQRHDARRLHYDFRLERDGVLASWAVPKGIPLEPGTQHLAVHVEDHPLDYATFEGEISAGNYGAGTVEIWDHGVYELVEEKRDGGLTVRLDGERLQGLWALVPAKLSGDPKNWLILKKREDGTDAGSPRRRWAPMLATIAERPPHGPGWSFEVKFDGYRAVGAVRAGEATLTSRTGNDLTGRFPEVARALVQAVRTPDAVVDGEVVAVDEAGRATFSAMQKGSANHLYYVFDVLEVDGEALDTEPLRRRRERLAALLDPRSPTVRLSESFPDGEELLRAAVEQQLEGIVAKRTDSPYLAGRRSRDWLKIKPRNRQELVIAGYTKGKGRRASSLGALVLGVRTSEGLVWAGNCGTGFGDAEIERLLGKLRALERKTSPFAVVPKMPRVRKEDVVWVAPKLVCEVEFVEWTHEGHLRAPSYVGLRDDKPAEEVRREMPLESEIRRGRRRLELTNLDKLFWPDEGITKGDLVGYYRDVAPALVPHLRKRPFTMKRYPDGWQGKFFFQKDAPKHMPDWIPRWPYPTVSRASREKRTIDAPLVNDELALLWMVNMGCIDMNAWYSRVDRPERPDWVLFDLDPPEAEGAFRDCVRVALLVRDVLDALDLASFPKTSGSDGIHVLVPISRRHTWEEAQRFARVVAGALARVHPGLVTTEFRKEKRRGVLIDANQNGEGRTIASVYSVRPRAGAPVSTPLRWDEVTPDLDPRAFTMEVALGRLERHGDLYAPVLSLDQSLKAALRRLA
jgi:bifunctional non-homologous end joining protein LigD